MSAAVAKLRSLAPYALLALLLPGGFVAAFLLWLHRRRRLRRQHEYESVAFVHVKMPFTHRVRRAEDQQLFSHTCDVTE